MLSGVCRFENLYPPCGHARGWSRWLANYSPRGMFLNILMNWLLAKMYQCCIVPVNVGSILRESHRSNRSNYYEKLIDDHPSWQGWARKRYMDHRLWEYHSNSLCRFTPHTQMLIGAWLTLIALLHPRNALCHLHHPHKDLLPPVLPPHISLRSDASHYQDFLRCHSVLRHHFSDSSCVSMLARQL